MSLYLCHVCTCLLISLKGLKTLFNYLSLSKNKLKTSRYFHTRVDIMMPNFQSFHSYSKRWRTSRRSTWSAANSSTAWPLNPPSTPTRKSLQDPQNPSRVRTHKHTKSHKRRETKTNCVVERQLPTSTGHRDNTERSQNDSQDRKDNNRCIKWKWILDFSLIFDSFL